MKRIAMIISGIILILGCVTLSLSLLISAVAPNILLVYLTAHSVSFGHDILNPNLTGPYIFSAAQILAGAIGMVYFTVKAKDR